MILKLSALQMEAVAAPARAEWCMARAQHIHATYSDYFTALKLAASDLEPVCEATARWAAQQNITGQRDVAKLCNVAISLGHQFWLDPRFQSHITNTLGNPNLARSHAVSTLVSHVADWLHGLWETDTLDQFSVRLCTHVRHGAGADTVNVRYILPQHWVLFDAETNERLLDWLKQSQPFAQFRSQQLANVACALVHGTGWRQDPQYQTIARLIDTSPTPPELADRLATLYSEMS